MKLVTKIFQRNNWYITSPFGYRESIETKAGITNTFHNGCDYGTHGEKWEQYAIESGKIIESGTDNDGANFILVFYPRINIKLLHYHLDKIYVKRGQNVNEGTLLGLTGQTGKATGIHLHLSLIDNLGNYIDPHIYEYEKSDKENFINKLAYEVISGKWGNGEERKNKLTQAGYNYKEIQEKVNNILYKSTEQVEQQYVVQKGDNLSKIAQKYNTTWKEIYLKNKNIIGNNPNIILPGLILKI